MARDETAPSRGLALVRLTLGVLVTRQAWDWAAGDGLAPRVVRGWLEGAGDGLFGWWADTVLLHNPDGTAFLLAWLTLAAGLGLTLGAFTRPAATWVALVAGHGWLAGVGHGPVAVLVLVVALACALSRAGRRLGLDAALDGSLPGWMTWVRGRSNFLD